VEFVSLNENTVKIIISYDELEELNISFEELQNNSFKASLFFKMLCKNLNEDFMKKSYVEIFNLDNEGLVIYFSKMPTLKTENKTHILVTLETENHIKLCNFCSELLKITKEIPESSLYSDDKNYRLIIKIPSVNSEGIKRLVNKLKIYARIGELVPSVTKEHTEMWKQITPKNAVKVLSEGF